nr:MAG TPA: hypothetical protein [Caudoviricetes sp.]
MICLMPFASGRHQVENLTKIVLIKLDLCMGGL